MTQHRLEGASRRRSAGRSAGALTLAAALALTGGLPAMAQTGDPGSDLEEGTFQTFEASNGYELKYHFFNNGGNGTLFYFDGDGTTNFDRPLVPGSSYWGDPEGNGGAQRLNSAAAARGFDFVFIDHPDDRGTGNSAWWYGANINAADVAVKEMVAATNDETVELAGYSGGAEFIVMWGVADDNSWVPSNLGITAIGGGGAPSYGVADVALGFEDMSIRWVVGENDRAGATNPPTWSAYDSAERAYNLFGAAGYTNRAFDVIPDMDHVNYAFHDIVGESMDNRLAARGLPSVTAADNGDGTFAVEASGLAVGAAVEATFTQAGTVVTAEVGTADVYGAFSGSVSIADGILPGRFTVSVASGSTTSSTLTSELRTANDDNPGLYQVYIGTNGKELQFHHFDNGDNGTLFYFDGDGTSNFHMPLVPASVSHTGGFNGQVQRLNAEAAERGVDLIFVEHPNSDNTWWENYADVLLAEDVVKEMVDDLGHDSVLLAGYSGGAEFLVSWMLIDGNDWGPDNTALVMIGGGTLDPIDELADPTEGRADQRISWVVGANDGVGATYPATWSALGAATEAQAQFASQGYTGAVIDVVPDTNHLQYNFRGIVGNELDLLLANAEAQDDDQTGGDDQTGDDDQTGGDDQAGDNDRNGSGIEVDDVNAGAIPTAPTPVDDAQDGSLPKTGAEPLWLGVLAALTLAALGGMAVMRTRRS